MEKKQQEVDKPDIFIPAEVWEKILIHAFKEEEKKDTETVAYWVAYAHSRRGHDIERRKYVKSSHYPTWREVKRDMQRIFDNCLGVEIVHKRISKKRLWADPSYKWYEYQGPHYSWNTKRRKRTSNFILSVPELQ